MCMDSKCKDCVWYDSKGACRHDRCTKETQPESSACECFISYEDRLVAAMRDEERREA